MNTQIQNKLRKKLATLRATRGFSLVELLVVIAVIGIIAAIAIPNIAGITGQADIAKAQRNAQSLASTFAAARAAGASNTVADAGAAADAIIAGSMQFPATSSYSGSNFKVPGVGASEKAAALGHLTLTGSAGTSQLEYTP